MSDEPENARFPREVWDDFAVHAARCGFASCLFTSMVAATYLHFVGTISDLMTGIAVGVIAALILTLPVVVGSTRFRHLGLAVVGASAFFLGIVSQLVTREANWWSFVAIFGGFACGAFSVARPQFVPSVAKLSSDWMERAKRFQRRYTWIFCGLALLPNLLGVVVNLLRSRGTALPEEVAALAFWYLVVLSAILCVWCWFRFTRPFVELCLEPVARLMYRIKATGAHQLPPFGSCLVIANHGFWFDPCILGVILPRPITPIMTQRFYNVWFLRPLLKYIFRVIVVPETPLKRETPELEQAVAALDRGEVVVIFPEGYLRRKEEVPLRRFGQGVWHILSARPHTPVVACWVEGGWGSKFSFKNGPPTKNKPMDFRRKIDVSVSVAEVVPVETLADQMATRLYLMNRVAAMRAELGLPPLPAFETPTGSESGVGLWEAGSGSQMTSPIDPA